MDKKNSITYGLNLLGKEDTYSMMLLLLYASTDNPKYTAISELAYILDHDSFINFIKYYEGQTIKIPTISELMDALRILLLYKHYKVDDNEWLDAVEMSGFDASESISVRHKLISFMKHIDEYNYKIGGVINSGLDKEL